MKGLAMLNCCSNCFLAVSKA